MTLPASDSLSTYGGALINYAAVEDATTDRDADAANQAYASCAAMTRTAARAVVRFTAAATTGAMILVSHDSVWGTGTAPTLARSSTGVFTITWPASVVDELGETHLPNLRYGMANCTSIATPYFPQVSVLANVATIAIFEGTVTPIVLDNAVGINFEVFVY